ncbi:MAG: diguanylate cyclase [Thiovulaceae bacterium]|nr:diguanylate cyclase [Sulfurimonadaceae bacterium]
MQISIFKIFKNIKVLFSLMLFLTVLLSATIVSEYSSFCKLENLQKEKVLATEIYTFDRDDIELANIQYYGKSSMLGHQAEILSDLYRYDYLSQLMHRGDYQNELLKLKEAVSNFNIDAGRWYTQEQLDEEALQPRKEQFAQTYSLLLEQINAIISDNLAYEQRRFYLQESLVLALLLLTVSVLFWTSRRLSQIQRDIKALDNEETTVFLTLEADAISRRMGRSVRTPTASNPAYLDPLTGINNYKGLVHEFGDKKSLKTASYTAVCIFSIDKLKEMESEYSQDFIETILKKVGFMLTLCRQHNDVIGRLDHNQFAVILFRKDKAAALNDCELVRKSVYETPFKTPDGQSLTVTLSGGLVQKFPVLTLEEVISKANKVLSLSTQRGGNRIAQLREKGPSTK